MLYHDLNELKFLKIVILGKESIIPNLPYKLFNNNLAIRFKGFDLGNFNLNS
jgi:hypothetical protein